MRYRPFDTEDFPLEDPNPEWTQENVIGTSIEVSSLRQGVWYEFQAQAVGDGETITDSDWSSSSEVYVIYSLGPIRIFLVTTTTGSVTIGGMRDQNGSGWLMNVSGAEGTVSPNSKGWVVVSGLSPSTLYEIKVKQLGVSGRNSDSSWSNILTVAPAESIRVYSHFLVTVEPIDDTSVIRKMELDNRVPMNGTEGQVLVWTENGPQWQTKNLVNGGSNNE